METPKIAIMKTVLRHCQAGLWPFWDSKVDMNGEAPAPGYAYLGRSSYPGTVTLRVGFQDAERSQLELELFKF